MAVTRAEHMAWCKQRALAEVEAGELHGAIASLASDFRKHPETDQPSMHMLVTVGLLHHCGNPAETRRFIEGFA
jgi:hypothetical protein